MGVFLPENWSQLNLFAFFLRLLAIPLILAWPVGIFMSAFIWDAPMKGMVDQVQRIAMSAALWCYPWLIYQCWKYSAQLSGQSPKLSLGIAAIPAVISVGLFLAYFVDQVKSKNLAVEIEATREIKRAEIDSLFAAKNFKAALKVYLPEEQRDSNQSWNYDLISKLRDLEPSHVNVELIEGLFHIIGPGINGTTRVLWYSPNLKDMSFVPSALMEIIAAWKRKGVTIREEELGYLARWYWDRIDLFVGPDGKITPRASMEKLIGEENPFLLRLFEIHYPQERPETAAQLLQKLGPFDPELVQKKGKIFGTPRHAVLLSSLHGFDYLTRQQLSVLDHLGAELAPEEGVSVLLSQQKLLQEPKQ